MRSKQLLPLLAGTAGIMATMVSGSAMADPLSVTSAITTPVTTAAASNGSAGDVSVASGGSIIVGDVGPALTVNSSNNVTNAGTIGSSATTGATALLVDGSTPITTTIANMGTISVTGTGGSGNVGLRIANGPVNGTISSGSASIISVTGDKAVGVSIESAFTGDVTLNGVSVTGATSTAISLAAPITGNVRLTGTNSSSGSGGIGVSVHDISGGLVNAGTVTVGATSSTTTDNSGNSVTGPAVAGIAGIRIAGSIGGGFLNDRYFVDSTGTVIPAAAAIATDTTITGTVTGSAGSPAVLVAPDSTSPANITLSAVGTAGTDDGYGFVNRGSLLSNGNIIGRASTAVLIQGASVGGIDYTATLANGFANQSTGSISAFTSGANATAIEFGSGAIAQTLLNQGNIVANDSATAGGASAYAVHIDAGAQIGSIVNSGTIMATTASGAASFAILDAAGSLTTISNSGTISAVAPTSGSTLRAIDLSAGTAAQTITNSGTITGDIVFGSGGGSYISNSGAFSGALAFGAGANRLVLAGTTVFADPVTLAGAGSLGVSIADSASLHFGGTAPTLSSLAASGQSTLLLNVGGSASALQIIGGAAFTDQSAIKLVIAAPGSRTLTVLTAAGGITTDHAATLIGTTSTPFLYTLSSATVGATDIQVTLHQKTAAEAGFTPAIAPLYDQSLVAMAGGGAAFQAIANLPDQASVLAAYRQVLPPSFGSVLARVAESNQISGDGLIAARMNSLAIAAAGEADSGSRWGLWAQEGTEFLRHRDAQDDPGFSTNGFQMAFGTDYRLTGTLILGIAGNFSWTDIGLRGQTTDGGKPLTTNAQIGDVYAHWSRGPFYIQAIGSFGHDSYKFHRTITIGGYEGTQTAQWSGTQMAASLIGGARLHFGRLLVEPSDAFTYSRLHEDGYAETGTGALDLTVDPQRIKLTTNTAKLAANYELPFMGGAFSFGARGAFVSRLDRNIPGVGARFTSGGDAFTLANAPLGRSETQEGATIGYHVDNFVVAFSGDRRQESGFSDMIGTATLRVSF
jgi:uncharacterized protein with beta-barrel porin domain